MSPFAAGLGWLTYWSAVGAMQTAAGEVILRRASMMAMGSMAAPEAARMVLEKHSAFAKGAERAALALARGATPDRVAAAALRPVAAAARANRKRLRR